MMPADVFGAIAGLGSSGAYKQLARLRSRGLARSGDESTALSRTPTSQVEHPATFGLMVCPPKT